jgi:hypothetical protein
VSVRNTRLTRAHMLSFLKFPGVVGSTDMNSLASFSQILGNTYPRLVVPVNAVSAQ